MTFGTNFFGQLGHGHTNDLDVPTIVHALEGSGVSHAVCGWDYCLAVTDAGDVYAWGNNQSGFLLFFLLLFSIFSRDNART